MRSTAYEVMEPAQEGTGRRKAGSVRASIAKCAMGGAQPQNRCPFWHAQPAEGLQFFCRKGRHPTFMLSGIQPGRCRQTGSAQASPQAEPARRGKVERQGGKVTGRTGSEQERRRPSKQRPASPPVP